MLVIVLCALLWDQCQPLSTCIEFQRQEHQLRPPTALQWGREEAVQFMQLTKASVWVFITSESHSWILLSERRGFAGRCPSYINSGVLGMWVKQPWRQTYVRLLVLTHNAKMVH